MTAERETRLLDLWEQAAGLDRWRRDDALLASAQEPLQSTPMALGARNLALLSLRNAHFDRTWPLVSRCPACATPCEFEVDSLDLARELDQPAAPGTVEWAGRPVHARPPTVEDLAAIALAHDVPGARRMLLARCLSDDADLEQADDDTLERLGQCLERLDPAASIGFTLVCPACSHAWTARIDVGEALWTEVRRAAERRLLEVDALARVYGWTEADVLRLSPTRRTAYLQLVEAG